MSHRLAPPKADSTRKTSEASNVKYHLVREKDLQSSQVPLTPTGSRQSKNYTGSKGLTSEGRRHSYASEEGSSNVSSRTCLEKLMDSTLFQTLISLMIISNGLVIGFETDFPNFAYWHIVENIFLAVFTFELCVRLFVMGRGFVSPSNTDCIWNIFDFTIVMLGLFDFFAAQFFGETKHGGVATLFRMIRLLRILRIFKIFRFLKKLYLLAYGFIEAAQAVFWVTCLMIFVLYICAIVLVRTVGRLPETDEHHAFLTENYGTIVKSMLTLFELMSNPDLNPYHGMRSTYPLLTVFLMSFIIFGSFGMIALLTGVISESMFEKNAIRLDEERLEREHKRRELDRRLAVIFNEIQPNVGEDATEAQVDDVMPLVAEIFNEMDVKYANYDLQSVVRIMDVDGSGSISKDEFIHSIISIADEVRPMSFAELYHTVSLVKSRVEKCLAKVDLLSLQHLEGRESYEQSREAKSYDATFDEIKVRLETLAEAHSKDYDQSAALTQSLQIFANATEIAQQSDAEIDTKNFLAALQDKLQCLDNRIAEAVEHRTLLCTQAASPLSIGTKITANALTIRDSIAGTTLSSHMSETGSVCEPLQRNAAIPLQADSPVQVVKCFDKEFDACLGLTNESHEIAKEKCVRVFK